ncbi:MAG: DNA repair protein RecN, partial [Pseudomonadota bacterium]|nr:DNA repair protein RecN [Pseudomonadota bacterium]
AQLALLDAYGRHEAMLSTVGERASVWKNLLRERETLGRQGDVSERIALLEHQLDELQRETLEPLAIAELVAAHRRHAHSAALIAACTAAFLNLAGDEAPSLTTLLQRTRSELQRVTEHEPRLAEIDGMLGSATIQLDEAVMQLERIRDDLDLDPSQLDELERRLTRIHDLARKHRVSPDQLSGRREAIALELDSLRGAGERVLRLDTDIAAAAEAWKSVSEQLSGARRKAAASLAQSTTVLIGELGMGGGRFEISLEANENERPDPNGAERAEFLVAANLGQPPRALRKVASGGELSRISLAIEVAALGLDAVPTMVFDEVDSGIGGAVAEIVGQKLRALGEKRQALCVTHLPQVAAQGHAHYRVSKAASDGVTQSAIDRLDDKQRAEELARMLGGVEVSKEARAAAKRLLQNAV